MLLCVIVIPILLSSCSSPTDSSSKKGDSNKNGDTQTTGTIKASVSTKGDNKDSDGYRITLGSNDTLSVDINGSVSFDGIDKGSYSVELLGLASNCSIDGNNPVDTTVTAGQTTNIDFSVNCKSTLAGKIAYTSSGTTGGSYQKIYIMNADGSTPEMLREDTDNNLINPDISPDGTKIVYVKGLFGNAQIWVMDADGSNATAIKTDGDNFGSVWSPDGKKIAFEDQDAWDISVMDADGSNEKNLTQSSSYSESDPAWSPDGNKIVYVKETNTFDGSKDDNLAIINSDGSDSKLLTQNDNYTDSNPSWSPDGSKIVFRRYDQGTGYNFICVINNDGSGLTKLIKKSGIVDEPQFSPDGSKIAFTNGSTIKIMNTDGSNVISLDNGTEFQESPSWGPAE